MVEFRLRLPDKQNVVWIPKAIVDSLGRNLKIAPDSLAAVLYPADADLQDVMNSLGIILQDLELRTKRKGKKEPLEANADA